MKSGTEKSTKHRAAGPEKSQDRPQHTELTLQDNETVTNREQQQQSSSSQDIDRINFDTDNHQLPVVDALATPNPGLRSILAHLATAQKLQETEQRVKHQATYIQDLEFQLRLQEAYKENLLRDRTISRLPSAPPSVLLSQETEIMEEEKAIQQLLDFLALRSKLIHSNKTSTHPC
jgi:hypothetical protein